MTNEKSQQLMPFMGDVMRQERLERAKRRRKHATHAVEAALRAAVASHVRIARLRDLCETLLRELEPVEAAWMRKRREDDRKRRARLSRERQQQACALEAIRNGKRGEIVLACIRAAAEVVGVERRALLSRTRGTPAEALARVVAMHACVCRGVPIAATAEAFQRRRRTVHGAIQIGRPGGEARDQEVLAKLREVLGKLNAKAMASADEKTSPKEMTL
jgi:hypothetical protein